MSTQTVLGNNLVEASWQFSPSTLQAWDLDWPTPLSFREELPQPETAERKESPHWVKVVENARLLLRAAGPTG